MIELTNITKHFGPVAALEKVSLQISPGQVHGLLGENGAGKSTLMNVLFGLLTPDQGQLKIDGKPARITSPRAAQRFGIGMVHQHFKLVPTLTVAENLAVALRMSVRTVQKLAADRVQSLRWNVPLNDPVENISVGQQQRAEILKALLAIEQTAGTRTLILDEPTAVLTPLETTELFAAIENLKSQKTAIVFISHKLAEVQRICEVVTILRRGKVVHTGPAAELSPERMAELMVGRVEKPITRNAAPKPTSAPAALELHNLTCGTARDISLHVARGEIVGIAGVDGNGQTDLVHAIAGLRPPSSGRILIAGQDATTRSIRWRNERMAFIPEDRHREAMVMPLSVEENLLLKDYRRPRFSTMGWLRFGAWRHRANELVREFDVRTHSVTEPAGRLSGGNQQKMVLARELHVGRGHSKPLVLAVNPTRGLDIGATAFVMRQLLAARDRAGGGGGGAGVLLVHSDLDELLAISDRVFVIFSGRLQESRWPNDTRESIGRMMLGLNAAGGAA